MQFYLQEQFSFHLFILGRLLSSWAAVFQAIERKVCRRLVFLPKMAAGGFSTNCSRPHALVPAASVHSSQQFLARITPNKVQAWKVQFNSNSNFESKPWTPSFCCELLQTKRTISLSRPTCADKLSVSCIYMSQLWITPRSQIWSNCHLLHALAELHTYCCNQ